MRCPGARLTLREPTLDDVFLELTGATSSKRRRRVTTATIDQAPVRARPAGFLADCLGIANRSIRAVPREIEFVVPALAVPVFYTINIGAPSCSPKRGTGIDFKAFQLPVAIIFAVTGLSRERARHRHPERILRPPAHDADPPVVAAPRADDGRPHPDHHVVDPRGPHGIHRRRPLRDRDPRGRDLHPDGGAVGLAFTGFPYAIALKTGNPAAVNTSFILFFPFAPHHVVPAARASADGCRRSPSGTR